MKNWAGNVTFTSDRVHRPRSVEELQETVARSEHLRPLGTAHSFNRIADTTGDLVSVGGLPGGLAVDDATSTVSVPAGARYGEVAPALQERGLALHNLGSLPHISIAGACATGTHGSGNRNRCLSAAAVGVEFVNASGELVRLNQGDADFGGAVLSLGALGVVTRLTLAVEPSYEIRQQVWLDAPLDTVLEHYDEITAAGYSVSLFSGPDSPGRIDQIWIKTRDGQPADGTRWGARPADADVHPLAGQDARAATEQRGVPGAWFERLPHFRLSFTPSAGDEQQTEYLVPREHAPAAIAAVHELDLGAALQVAEFRTIAADDMWLSPFHQRATAGIHFTWHNDDEAVAPAVAAVEKALAAFDPRPHWGKRFGVGADVVRAQYPRLAEFRALAARHDPERKFGNAFLDEYVY